MKSATGSFPTAVNNATCNPNRRAPTAIFVGEPPTYAAKLFISTKGPTSFAYKSMEERPMVMRSNCVEALAAIAFTCPFLLRDSVYGFQIPVRRKKLLT